MIKITFINLIRKSKNPYKRDEYQYKIRNDADIYFGEAVSYKRPIVNKIYKDTSEMFDSHSYEKASVVLHMLRNHIGDKDFRDSLKLYLERYKYRSVETGDLRQIFEEVSGKSLQGFFDQWLYRKGHPELNIEFSLDKDSRNLSIKVLQTQAEDVFEFSLEIKIVYSNNQEELNILHIVNKEEEKKIELPQGARIACISVDPEFKILNSLKSIKVLIETEDFNIKDLLKSQLEKGKTLFEKIRAARALRNNYSPDVVEALKRKILANEFYGVAVEAASTLGSYYDKNNYNKTKNAFEALRTCLEKGTFLTLTDEVRKAIVDNTGNFEMAETVETLQRILKDKDDSYFVEQSAASAIGKCGKTLSANNKKQIINLLKDITSSYNSFQKIVSQGAIEGLVAFWNDKDKENVLDIGNFLLEKSQNGNDYFIRLSSTFALRKFIRTKFEKGNKLEEEIIKMNNKVFAHLIKMLTDKRREIKINACTALADPDAIGSKPDGMTIETIDALISVSEHDVDGFVRKKTERTLNILREWIKEWADKPPLIELKIREKADPIEIIEKKSLAKHLAIEEAKKNRYEEELKRIRRPFTLY